MADETGWRYRISKLKESINGRYQIIYTELEKAMAMMTLYKIAKKDTGVYKDFDYTERMIWNGIEI